MALYMKDNSVLRNYKICKIMLKVNNYVKNTAVGTFIGLAAWGTAKFIIATASGAVTAAYLKYKMKKALQEEAEN